MDKHKCYFFKADYTTKRKVQSKKDIHVPFANKLKAVDCLHPLLKLKVHSNFFQIPCQNENAK